MSEHRPPVIVRHCDVAIIGASAAGLAAGLQLGRQRRSVIVVDSGEPRNAPAAHMHSYLGHEGMPPAEFTKIGREEVRSYGGEVLSGRVNDVSRINDEQFVVRLTGGHEVIARRVLAATGLVDDLPQIEGLAQHWGRDAIHCPFCHGYEVRDQHLVQIITHPMGLHPAVLFRQLSAHLTLVLHDGVAPDHPQLEILRNSGVAVVDQRVQRIVADEHGRVCAVEFVGGDRIKADALAIGPRFRVRAEVLESLGVRPVQHVSGLGDFIETTPAGETSAPGIYAAGNITDPSQQMLNAAAQGSWVGAMIAVSLANEDMLAATRSSGNERDWDNRYSGDQIWSGNPNGALVHEVSPLAAGRVLDVGAGEGGDAVWLAERGWHVTATDVSQRALDRITAVANERALSIACVHTDANSPSAYGTAAFDLVSAHYASIPRTADNRAVANLLDAVAPGGTLLIVGHDLEPMRKPIETTEHSRPFDPDAYVRIEDFISALTNDQNWTIELHETRARPAGAASHHANDVVLRAKRAVA